MDLRQLRHFIAVVEQGSFSRAAQQVHLTQPALTRSIQALEDAVGVLLLDRTSSGVHSTRAGQAMYQHAKLMINEAERARHEVRLAAEGLGGELTLAVGEMFMDHHIHRAVARLLAEHDRVSVTVRQLFIEEAVPLLLDGQVDLALSVVPAMRMQTGLMFQALAPVPFAVFAGAGHPLAAAPAVTMADLTRQRWAMLDRPHADDFMARYFASGRQALPAATVRVDSLALMRALVLHEGFLALLPVDMMVGRAAAPVAAPDMPIVRQAGLLYRSDAPLRPLADRWVAHLREGFGPT
ncbi:LysR family transcriptional regulator [Nitrospirillum sp. BR 11828]|uniref:LysR family transcriptional regulator n=1 Tax=Nitrospirillum sp. BR 11828 TaxID=3104325 RepID=UPI002ACA3B89|nr:LysR family transcriptional regulator [Nitrospirillum sp. BR 11828]MDZ5645875.1 LysR family transcriptional regulator [Nitrospirillum sp. BR 11828]